MNRALFITIAIVAIIFLFLGWLFLFINGAPANTAEIFSDLGIIKPVERSPEPELGNSRGVVLDLSGGKLQQITTSAVAGYATASTTGEQPLLRYVERGTGYIFEVNLNSGLQNQVTPSTMPNTTEATFSPDLRSVVLVTENDTREVTLLEIPRTAEVEVTRTALPTDAENIEFLDDNTVGFTRNSYTETVGYTFDLSSKTTAERFRTTLPDATVVTTATSELFAYPKPSALLEGSLYEIVSGQLAPASTPQKGLVAFIEREIGIVSYIDIDNTYQSYRLPNYIKQPILMLPEKCVLSSEPDVVWCAIGTNASAPTFLEDWYKGITNSDDAIYSVNTASGEISIVAEPKNSTGRQLDVVSMSADPKYKNLFFINKIDSTLWLLAL